MLMPFGKYKGLGLKTVFKNDKRYVEWLVTTDWYNFGQEIQTIPSNTILSSEAQIFNGLLLPIIGLFLLLLVASNKLKGYFKNQILIKTCLTLIIVFYIFLGLKNFGIFF